MVLENGIPIPPARKGCPPRTTWGPEIRAMQVGQSRFFTELGERNSAKAVISKLGWRCCVRRGMHDGMNGWRLWRVA